MAKANSQYDVFISYRRVGGFETARHLYDLLKGDGYSVSFDLDCLRSGRFDMELLARIDACTDFIVVLNPGCFDRTLDSTFPPENDWLRQELARALKMKKNVVPVMLANFVFPEGLPDDIKEVAKMNGPQYSNDYFDSFYAKLKMFLKSQGELGSRGDPQFVVCPVCNGNIRLVGTHNCDRCHKKYVCADCWDSEYRCCIDCAVKAREAAHLLEEGRRFEETDAKKAVACFRKAAVLGDREACHKYGDLLLYGWLGVVKDVASAFSYYQKADASNPWVQHNIGKCHLEFFRETGNPDEARQAVEWLRKSAECGVPWSCYELGDCHRNGIGVPQDFAAAASWYNRALRSEGIETYGDHGAAQWAEFWMGCLYRDGHGVERDPVRALQLFRKAAERKDDAAEQASKEAAEVLPNVLAARVGAKLESHWEEFRIIHGVQIRDADGRLVPLAVLVASNRGVFVGVSIERLPSNIRNSLPSENPAWPFAVEVAKICGLPTESPPLFGVLVVPDDYPSPNGGFPFWVIREQDVASKMLSLGPCPDCEKNRQNLIRLLETLPMSSVGAEANALMHFTAPISEWEDGVALLPKVDRPSPRLLAFAQRAAVELKRVGNGAADAVFSWLDKFAGTPMPVTVAGVTKTIALPGGAEMELIWCPPGEFMMGSPGDEEGRGRYETQHRVQLKKGFWLGRYPVTQRQWRAVMGNNPSHFKGDDLPVERVSWNDCQGFIKKVNAAFQCGARLPTESEWEYACRAGTATVYSWGNALNGDKANCIGITPYGTRKKGPYLKKTTPVGKYGANPWGLSDMHGNVYEWCTDWYGPYPAGHVVDPLGSALGNGRVLRGGSWDSYAKDCRSAHRAERRPGFLHECYGFRLCCSAMPVQ